MKRVPANAGWLAFNAIAALILLTSLSHGRPDWTYGVGLDSGLESGKWAFRLLLVSLSMTPLRAIMGWRAANNYRKPAGLWAFAFAAVHFLYYLDDIRLTWAKLTSPLYLAFGLLAIIILTAMALTSYRAAMRALGRWWKRLHRLVYIAGGAICVHALLATESSKRLLSLDPKSVAELYLYAALMAALLGMRIPFIRRLARRAVASLRPSGKLPDIVPIDRGGRRVPAMPPRMTPTSKAAEDSLLEHVGIRQPPG